VQELLQYGIAWVRETSEQREAISCTSFAPPKPLTMYIVLKVVSFVQFFFFGIKAGEVTIALKLSAKS